MRRLVPFALVLGMLVCAASAQAATGDLTFKDCLAKFATSPCGAVPNEVLDGGRDVAVSPDGSHVYVADNNDSIVWFSRSPSDGSLTYAGCVDNGTETGCTHLPTHTLELPRSLAFSPDGTSLYAALETSDDVVRFDVAGNGALSFGSCVEDDDVFDSGCGQQVANLNTPLRVVVSPDGNSVYATNGPTSGEGELHQFTAALAPVNCYREEPDVGCAGEAAPIDVPYGLAISPDGKHLYVTSVGRDAIAWFSRGSGGSLTQAGCIADGDDTTEFTEGCAEDPEANYDFMNHITFNPDGSDAYVTDETGLGVVYHFTRDSLTGALTRADCLADSIGDAPGCTELNNTTGSGLSSVTDAVVSPDAVNLYAVAYQDEALSTFSLASPSGAMTFVRCLRALEYQGCAGFAGESSLAGPFGVALSPDGHDLYVSNTYGNPAVLHFEREAPGTREGGEEPGEEEPGPEEPGTGGGSGGSGSGSGGSSTPPPSPKPGPTPKPTEAPKCGGFKATIVGSAKADSLKGTAKKDVIAAGAGNDKVSALGGKDIVCGEGGNDQLGGGPGADLLLGGPGRDTLRGNGGVDRFVGGPGRDVVKQ